MCSGMGGVFSWRQRGSHQEQGVLAVDDWRKLRLATDALNLNGEEETACRQWRENLAKVMDMNFRKILEDVSPRVVGRSMPLDRPGFPD